jgi:hypothetical protein
MKSCAIEAPTLPPQTLSQTLSDPPGGRLAAAASGPGRRPSRRRGRPIEMAPETVLERVRALAARREGLFRVHHTHPALYARARRLFGSWEGAVLAAGLDYRQIVEQAAQRAIRARRQVPRRTLVTLP